MTPRPLELFYSYSHKDEELRNDLEEHLTMLKREGVIASWHDRRISGGSEWEGQIDKHLNSADIILLLTSSTFLASDYCYDIEVKRAMERHLQGEARVIPVIIRACDWHNAPFGKLQAFPKDGKPVKQWPDPDAAFLDIANGIRRVADEMRTTKIQNAADETEPEFIKASPLIPDLRVNFVSRKDNGGNDIVKLLQDELSPRRPRLVALWGAGGVGKTAIAAEAARGVIEAFGKRVAWVSADGLESFGFTTLLDEIASQLGHSELRKLSLDLKKDQVRDVVRTAPTLVVLDNFETIEEAERQRCVDWLGSPAPCSALITTRDVIQGGRNIPIEGMRPDEANALLDQLIGQAHDAKAFSKLDRVRLIQTAESNPLVLQWIVGQIDLAQDPDEVLDELRHGEGTAAERVFSRSYELRQLNNGGRAVLLALSLFAPSATRKAIAEVSSLGKDGDRRKFRDSVRSLSALWLIRTADEGHRLAVEGLTRELTKARLDADPRGKTFRPRFVSRYLRYAEIHSRVTREDYDALELEKDNLLNAMDVAAGLHDSTSVLRLLDAINSDSVNGFLTVRGYWDEVIRRNKQGLKAARDLSNEIRIARTAHNLATIYQKRGDFGDARSLYSESLEITKKRGWTRNIADTLHNLAALALDQGALSEARQLYTETLELRKQLRDERGIATNLHELARLSQNQGDFEEACRLYNESMKIKERLGDEREISITLLGLGAVKQDQGELGEAKDLYETSLTISEKLGDQSGIASCSHQLGTVHLAEFDYESAEKLLQQSLGILRRLGNRMNCAECLESIGKLRMAQGRLPAAAAFFSEALGIAEMLGIPFRIASINRSLGLLEEKLDDKARAAKLLTMALTGFESLKSPKAEDVRKDLERLEGKSPGTP